jgi:cell division ATPase FtsA
MTQSLVEAGWDGQSAVWVGVGGWDMRTEVGHYVESFTEEMVLTRDDVRTLGLGPSLVAFRSKWRSYVYPLVYAWSLDGIEVEYPQGLKCRTVEVTGAGVEFNKRRREELLGKGSVVGEKGVNELSSVADKRFASARTASISTALSSV